MRQKDRTRGSGSWTVVALLGLAAACALYLIFSRSPSLRDPALPTAADPADELFRKGVIQNKQGDPARARRFFEKALEINPDHVWARFSLGELYLRMALYEDALRELRKAEAAGGPAMTALEHPVRKDLGFALMGLNRFEEAVKELRRALELEPMDREVRRHCKDLEEILLKEGRAKEATRPPEGDETAETLNRKADGLIQQGDYAEAERALVHARRLDRANTETEINLGRLAVQRGQSREALDHLEIAVAREPKNARAHYYLGGILDELERHEEAELHFRKAIQIDPGMKDAYLQLAFVYHDLADRSRAAGDGAKAVEWLQSAQRMIQHARKRDRDFPQAVIWEANIRKEIGELRTGEVTPAIQIGTSVEKIRTADVRDPAALVARIRDGRDPLSQYLRVQLSEKLRRRLSDSAETGETPADLSGPLIEELNLLISGENLYDPERFAGPGLPPHLAALAGSNPGGEDLIRLNRLLLQAAYPALFAARSEKEKSDGPR